EMRRPQAIEFEIVFYVVVGETPFRTGAERKSSAFEILRGVIFRTGESVLRIDGEGAREAMLDPCVQRVIAAIHIVGLEVELQHRGVQRIKRIGKEIWELLARV